MSRPSPATLTPDTTSLAVIDWQIRLFDAMNPDIRDRAARCAQHLCWLARELQIPTVVSEQYPKGLGPTLDLLNVEGSAVEKTTFSAMQTAAFQTRMDAIDREQVLLTGMETHICVAQTCRDLLAQGRQVWVVSDACLSRNTLDWRTGLERMRIDGARLTTTEAVLFELIGGASTPLFKQVSRRVRDL